MKIIVMAIILALAVSPLAACATTPGGGTACPHHSC